MKTNCPSCDSSIGKLHDPYCNRELCPFCHDFISTCDCIFEVLSLTNDERKIVEEFIDDSEDPLKSIVERWDIEVIKKGRVPY